MGARSNSRPSYFLGAAASPFASRPEFQAIREHKKVNAGAQFFQTNLVFDPDGLEIWLNELAKRNILDKVYILVGITPLKTLKMAQYMHDEVPGVTIPDQLLKRLEAAGDGVEEEGVTIALELIEAIKGKQGDQRHPHHGGWLGRDRAAHRHRGRVCCRPISRLPSLKRPQSNRVFVGAG